MSKKFLVLVIAISQLYSEAFSQQPVVAQIISLCNTTWYGNDSDGDFHEFTFLTDGRLTYRTNTSRKDTAQFNSNQDMWFQRGNEIVFVLSNYTTYLGKIEGANITGISWNLDGKEWTWKFKYKAPAPAEMALNTGKN